jgi:hypothetical protein
MTWKTKAALGYLAIGVAVRLSGRAISNTVNIENSVGSVLLWPAVLLNGFSNVPLKNPSGTGIAVTPEN